MAKASTFADAARILEERESAKKKNKYLRRINRKKGVK